MKTGKFFLLPIIIVLTGCSGNLNNNDIAFEADLTQYVNPFIGTDAHGHTFPGASMPFGMVQLSPDTRLEGWDGCGGYHYSDSIVYGLAILISVGRSTGLLRYSFHANHR